MSGGDSDIEPEDINVMRPLPFLKKKNKNK